MLSLLCQRSELLDSCQFGLIFFALEMIADNWGISSAGRAPALQAGGRRFDPVILHQLYCVV